MGFNSFGTSMPVEITGAKGKMQVKTNLTRAPLHGMNWLRSHEPPLHSYIGLTISSGPVMPVVASAIKISIAKIRGEQAFR